MAKKANVVIVGAGNIGRELRRQLEAKGHHVFAQASSSVVRFHDGTEEKVGDRGNPTEICDWINAAQPQLDALMIATPNAKKGANERHYMQYFSALEVPSIVTCAKAAHAYCYPDVLRLKSGVGRRATVGGGTDMLEVLRRRHLQDEDVLIDVVANGTLNHIFHGVQGGSPVIGAIGDAKDLKLAEPGATDNVAILNGELDDLCMKAAILHNVALSDGEHFITPDDFRVCYLEEEEDIHRLASRNRRSRFILTFASVKDHDVLPDGERGSLSAQCGRWRIRGNFHNVAAETPWFDWLRDIGDAQNGWRISPRSKDGPYSLVGPGAGPEVTAKAMVRDLEDLLEA